MCVSKIVAPRNWLLRPHRSTAMASWLGQLPDPAQTHLTGRHKPSAAGCDRQRGNPIVVARQDVRIPPVATSQA